MCSTSPPSASTHATTPASCNRSPPFAPRATPSSWWNTTPRPCARPDCIIDLGPGAGRHGGEILAQGNLDTILASADSLTPAATSKAGMVHPLRGKWRELPPPPTRHAGRRRQRIGSSSKSRACATLKGGTLRFPKGRLIGVCGISGAGKSTLVRDLLQPAVAVAIRGKEARLKGSAANGLALERLLHAESFRQVIEVDQSPIGKNAPLHPGDLHRCLRHHPRLLRRPPPKRRCAGSGRALSLSTPRAVAAKTCKGAGRIALEMNFIADTYLTCEDCGGRRYGPELLGIHWKDRSIADILEMSFEEAADFFSFHQPPRRHAPAHGGDGTGLPHSWPIQPTLSAAKPSASSS